MATITIGQLIQSSISGYSGISGFSGFSGAPGPSTTINATDDSTTATLYPVMVGAAGSNQTAKASTTKLSFNASTGSLAIGNLLDLGATDAISAAGTTQGTATTLVSSMNNVTTVAAGTGVLLPTTAAGLFIVVRNGGANPLAVYPTGTTQINGAGASVAYSLEVGATIMFVALNATNWYTLGGTYA